MSLKDDIKVSLRVSSPKLDPEVEMLIAAAKADMVRVGVPQEFLGKDMHPIAKAALTCYCKANWGWDVDDAARQRFAESYRQHVIDMMNSPSLFAEEESE